MLSQMTNPIRAERVSASALVLAQRHLHHFQRGCASLAAAVEPVGS
ncbi:hypothetical protein [Shewanella algae]